MSRTPYKIVYTQYTNEEINDLLEALYNNQKFQAIIHKWANNSWDTEEFISTYWEIVITEIPRFNIEKEITPRQLINALLVKPIRGSDDDYVKNKLLKYLKILLLRVPSIMKRGNANNLPLEDFLEVEDISNQNYYPSDFKIFIDYHLGDYLTQQQYQEWLDILNHTGFQDEDPRIKHYKKIINRAYQKYKGS